MSFVKSLSVGNGDMFYIRHSSDNFTMIDCCMPDEREREIIAEIKLQSKGKGIHRFISTHPDEDHLLGLAELNKEMKILNFYCVQNCATKQDQSKDFQEYCTLRDDSEKVFHLHRDCTRKWMNLSSDERGAAGIQILWPVTDNDSYIEVLKQTSEGGSPNNISPMIKYGLDGGVVFLWMGDLETEFMEKIESDVELTPADIFFAPHHGRDSGKVPEDWLKVIAPKVIIIGEAPSGNLNYYANHNTITQNSAGDISFECTSDGTHIYVSNHNYSVDFLDNRYVADSTHGKYIGSL